ncbi:MAG: bifunctional metallophosphatase/5'-nucleotidase [Deltaproteobacteria bacterium]|nr:MAG: bifunctional metallophosphatase/5'-nucleotidase [Deltaproteobacteria bacterium]
MNLRTPFTVLVLAVWLASCGGAPTPPVASVEDRIGPEAPRTLTVIGISDFHGALEPLEVESADGHIVTVGGAALIAAYIERIRQDADGPVVILDGGDLFQGTLVSNLQLGAPVIRFHNHIGVTAAAVGNHEFDFGPDTPERTVPLLDEDDPRGALKARAAEASFPLLAVNMRDGDGEIPSWSGASVVVEHEGVRIGIIGAATEDTATTTVGANVVGLDFPFAAPFIADEAERLQQEEGVDLLLLTAHFGAGCADFSDPDDTSSCRPGEMFRVLDDLPEGLLRVAVGGHTHQGVAHRYRDTAVIQAFAQGRALALAVVDLETPGFPVTIHPPVPVCGSTVAGRDGPTCHPRAVPHIHGPAQPALFRGAPVLPDPAVEALLADDFAAVAELRERDLGVDVGETLTRSYREESPLGNLVADAMREAIPGADVAAVNGGGIRAELEPGRLTYGRLFEVLPFDNRFVILDVDGETLARIVRHGVTSGRSALLWSGVEFRAVGCDVVEIRVGDELLDPSARYTLVLNDYLAGGGSGFDTLGLPEADIRWDLEPVREAVARILGQRAEPLLNHQSMDPAAPRQVREGECAP